jgi:hypothetical protein
MAGTVVFMLGRDGTLLGVVLRGMRRVTGDEEAERRSPCCIGEWQEGISIQPHSQRPQIQSRGSLQSPRNGMSAECEI